MHTQQETNFDASYLEGLKTGDPAITEHFYRYFNAAITRRLQCRTRSYSVIEDLRQETFLRVIRAVRRPGAIEHPERFAGYVLSVCHHVLYEYLRQEKGRTEDDSDIRPDTRPGPEASARYQEMRDRVRLVLAAMPERYRQVLSLAAFEEATQEEISRKMNVKRSNVRLLLHRARGRFREVASSSMLRNAPVAHQCM